MKFKADKNVRAPNIRNGTPAPVALKMQDPNAQVIAGIQTFCHASAEPQLDTAV
jgi:hypothetical protein